METENEWHGESTNLVQDVMETAEAEFKSTNIIINIIIIVNNLGNREVVCFITIFMQNVNTNNK